MQLNTIILMRHAERLDRALEAKGEDWISTASRPQDTPLSPAGREQARRVGQQLKASGYPIRKILCSPMIRCVETADIVAAELGLQGAVLGVETGLLEESKSMRGKEPPEPLPVWDPLFLPASRLRSVSSRVDESYTPVMQVHHVRNEDFSNHVQELLPDWEGGELHPDEVTRLRCRHFVHALLQSSEVAGEQCVLCVGHGATVRCCASALQEGLPPSLMISGERHVSCFAAFTPFQQQQSETHILSEIQSETDTATEEMKMEAAGQAVRLPWFAPRGEWCHADSSPSAKEQERGATCDHKDDRG